MKNTIIEVKAICRSYEEARRRLRSAGAHLHGVDHQVDTYFITASGRLKLRQGDLENNLIHYERADQSAPKLSTVIRCATESCGNELREVLAAALGIDTVVAKEREIYFRENVKVHLDNVSGLGAFVEVEAIGEDGRPPLAELRRQCDELIAILGIEVDDLCDRSYSDMRRLQ